MALRAALCLALAAALLACRVEVGAPNPRTAQSADPKPHGVVTIYSSMYREVIDDVDPWLESQLPDVDVEWLQAGSEKIATRLDAELAAGATQADLVLTSDPLWYERLARAGHFLPYASLRALRLPREGVHPDGLYVTSRISTMVIAYDTRKVSPEAAPKSFQELYSPAWKKRVTLADPLGSGTTYTSLAVLSAAQPDLIDRIRAAEAVAAGGNSSALTRLESGEQQVAMVLLENVLEAMTRHAPIGLVVPEDGAVLIPGPIAILKLAPNPNAAKAVYDLLLDPQAQRRMVKGRLHSPYAEIEPPAGAPTLEQLERSPHQVTRAFLDATLRDSEGLRARFSALAR